MAILLPDIPLASEVGVGVVIDVPDRVDESSTLGGKENVVVVVWGRGARQAADAQSTVVAVQGWGAEDVDLTSDVIVGRFRECDDIDGFPSSVIGVTSGEERVDGAPETQDDDDEFGSSAIVVTSEEYMVPDEEFGMYDGKVELPGEGMGFRSTEEATRDRESCEYDDDVVSVVVGSEGNIVEESLPLLLKRPVYSSML